MGLRTLYVVLGLFLFSVSSLYSREPHFSQFYSAPNVLSPSLAGSSGGIRFVVNYRNQWPGISNTYQTYAFVADMYLNTYKSGFGILFVSEMAGSASLNTSYLGLQYSYRVKLGLTTFLKTVKVFLWLLMLIFSSNASSKRRLFNDVISFWAHRQYILSLIPEAVFQHRNCLH